MVKNTKGLGYYQKHMLNFLKKMYALHNENRMHSISREREMRRVATSLEKRGLVIVNRDFECWTVRLA